MSLTKCIFATFIILLCGHWIDAFAALKSKCQPIVFKYTNDEISVLKDQVSSLKMSKNDLQKWDAIAKQEVDENKISFYTHLRLFTYLYVAQEEVANLSCMLKGSYEGSLDPISKKVVTLFLPHSSLALVKSDSYSEAIANIVFPKIQKRFDEENALKTEFFVPKEQQKMFSAGLEVAKWIPWYATPAKVFWAAPPPSPKSPQWKDGIAEITAAQSKLSQKNINTIYRWAGKPDRWSDDWRSIANQYIFNNDIPFSKVLEARTVLTISLYDTVAAYMTMKYHYRIIRPQIYDPIVTYIINVPKHPTYPAGHSAEASDASIILSYLFPENADEWKTLANEASLSRIWAGIHFPVDIEAGKVIGKKVSAKILSSIYSK